MHCDVHLWPLHMSPWVSIYILSWNSHLQWDEIWRWSLWKFIWPYRWRPPWCFSVFVVFVRNIRSPSSLSSLFSPPPYFSSLPLITRLLPSRIMWNECLLFRHPGYSRPHGLRQRVAYWILKAEFYQCSFCSVFREAVDVEETQMLYPLDSEWVHLLQGWGCRRGKRDVKSLNILVPPYKS